MTILNDILHRSRDHPGGSTAGLPWPPQERSLLTWPPLATMADVWDTLGVGCRVQIVKHPFRPDLDGTWERLEGFVRSDCYPTVTRAVPDRSRQDWSYLELQTSWLPPDAEVGVLSSCDLMVTDSAGCTWLLRVPEDDVA